MAPISAVHESVRQLIGDNDKENFVQAGEILLKFANNIINFPNEEKYRKIRLSNAVVENKLLPVSGALQCFFEMGFQEDGDFLTLPKSHPLAELMQIRNELQEAVRLAKLATGPGQVATTSSGTQNPASTQSSAMPRESQNPQMPGAPNRAVFQKEREFLQKVESYLSTAMQYEDPKLQQKAREVIPVLDLKQEAESQLQNIRSNSTDTTIGYQDCFILSLLKWFKSFFNWVDSPACDSCGGKTVHSGMAPPSSEDLRFGASRVEQYKCSSCGIFVRFPRYNDPGKLLETHKGRCGEWANCFTLCCRATGFEARFVVDWTDHVWTEVYSIAQKRWLHCDPCENICDKPLLYEKGWGKKLSYVIAFSKDEVVDVSSRYTADRKAMTSRRNEVRDDWLMNLCFRLWTEKERLLSQERRKEMMTRRLYEAVELLNHALKPSSAGNDLGGRTTGSLQWRLARGELGDQSVAQDHEPYVFTLTKNEIENKVFHLRYNCAANQYTRVSDNKSVFPGFASCMNKCKDIFRKEEHDWKMVYLARLEGASVSAASWKFDFKDSKLKISTVAIRVNSAKYENGMISWRLCSDDKCLFLKGKEEMETFSDLEGMETMTLTVNLSGGKGDNAWQHTQLFRQPLDDKDSSPFEIIITFI